MTTPPKPTTAGERTQVGEKRLDGFTIRPEHNNTWKLIYPSGETRSFCRYFAVEATIALYKQTKEKEDRIERLMQLATNPLLEEVARICIEAELSK